jgi:hypothetical protein
MEFKVAELTLREVDPTTPLREPLMFALPGAAAVATPATLMLATAVLSEAQVTSRVMFWVLESLNDPVAV